MEHSKTFQPIQTALITKAADSALQSHRTERLYKVVSGIETVNYRMPDLAMIDGSGSAIVPQLLLRNANNRASALSINIGFFRMICSNGLFVGTATFTQRVIHRVGPKSAAFLESVEDSVQAAIAPILDGSLAAEVHYLESIPVPYDDGLQAIYSLNAPDRVKVHAALRWSQPIRTEDTERSLYSLLNIVNESNRLYSGLNKASMERNIKLAEDLELLVTGGVAA